MYLSFRVERQWPVVDLVRSIAVTHVKRQNQFRYNIKLSHRLRTVRSSSSLTLQSSKQQPQPESWADDATLPCRVTVVDLSKRRVRAHCSFWNLKIGLGNDEFLRANKELFLLLGPSLLHQHRLYGHRHDAFLVCIQFSRHTVLQIVVLRRDGIDSSSRSRTSARKWVLASVQTRAATPMLAQRKPMITTRALRRNCTQRSCQVRWNRVSNTNGSS